MVRSSLARLAGVVITGLLLGAACSAADDAAAPVTEAVADDAAPVQEADADVVTTSDGAVIGPVFETVAGSTFDMGSIEGTDTLLWFWAPW